MKKLTATFVCMIMLVTFTGDGLTVSAYQFDMKVYDLANVFELVQNDNLEIRIAALTEKTGIDFGIITTSDTWGKTLDEFAAFYYRNHGYGDDCVLLFLDLQSRVVLITSYGEAELDSVSIYKIIKKLLLGNEKDDYYGFANTFLNEVEPYFVEEVSVAKILITPILVFSGITFELGRYLI